MTFDYVCARRNEIDPKGPCHIYIYVRKDANSAYLFRTYIYTYSLRKINSICYSAYIYTHT